MKANMGSIDRVIRIILAAVIGVLIFTGTLTGTVMIVVAIVAILFLLTSIISFCPLYLPFKISTRQKADAS